MRLAQNLFGLPTSLLILIASQSLCTQVVDEDQSALEWPFNLPPHAKYWPEDPPNRRRDLEAIDEHVRLGRTPVGVMKMGVDEGEKFFPEYWQFEGELEHANQAPLRPRTLEEEARLLLNTSTSPAYNPPFALHSTGSKGLNMQELKPRAPGARQAAAVLALLQRRDYQCPTGTTDCSAIGFPNSCCTTGETCYEIQDTGFGGVGCCVGCIPGVVTIQTTQTIVATSSISSGLSLSTSTVVIVTTSGVVTITASPTTTDTFTGLQTTLACTNGYSACPVNAGGGCCLSGRICGSLSCPLPAGSSTSTSTSTETSETTVEATTTTTSATGVPPVRPTSATVTTTSTSTDAGATDCPTGFYACSAFYQGGGCCRTGRDCQPTSCPPTSSTTIQQRPLDPAQQDGSPALPVKVGIVVHRDTHAGQRAARALERLPLLFLPKKERLVMGRESWDLVRS
ncbi:GPI anchored protein [Phlyctema vagabunda]|uniref:GPI anchored protein n=1 Tax=Phlyctema vagabunda TaxID=108571 RepID=A0ABR4PR25_9HELO